MGVDTEPAQPLDFVRTEVTPEKLAPSPKYPKLAVFEAERLNQIGAALQSGKNLPEATKTEYSLLQKKAVGIVPTAPSS